MFLGFAYARHQAPCKYIKLDYQSSIQRIQDLAPMARKMEEVQCANNGGTSSSSEVVLGGTKHEHVANA